MKKPKIFFNLLILGLLSSYFAQAQNAVLSTGGNASNSNGSVSYSMGQVVYNADSSASGKISEGVQQAYEIFTVGGIENQNIQLVCAAYPNPTTDFLTLEITNQEIPNMSFELLDASGKLLLKENTIENQNQIRLGAFAEGVYFLKIYNNNQAIKTFKVIKNQ